MSSCPNGHEVPDGYLYCGECGTEVTVRCPEGHEVGASDSHCTECGVPLGFDTAAAPAPDDAGDDSEEPTAPTTDTEESPASPPASRRSSRRRWPVAAVVALLVLAVGGYLMLNGDGSDDATSATPTQPTAASTTAPPLTSTTRPSASTTSTTLPPDPDVARVLYGLCGPTSGPDPFPVEPETLLFGCDATGIVNDITWTAWTDTEATGTGTAAVTGCDPSCAEGTTLTYPADIRLDTPVTIGCTAFYSHLTITFPGPAPPDAQTINGSPGYFYDDVAPTGGTDSIC